MISESEAPSIKLLHRESVAVFIGIQRSGRRGHRNIPLYNLKRPLGHHVAGATVSDRTLKQLGYAPPVSIESTPFFSAHASAFVPSLDQGRTDGARSQSA